MELGVVVAARDLLDILLAGCVGALVGVGEKEGLSRGREEEGGAGSGGGGGSGGFGERVAWMVESAKVITTIHDRPRQRPMVVEEV